MFTDSYATLTWHIPAFAEHRGHGFLTQCSFPFSQATQSVPFRPCGVALHTEYCMTSCRPITSLVLIDQVRIDKREQGLLMALSLRRKADVCWMVAFAGRWLICSRAVWVREERSWFTAPSPRLSRLRCPRSWEAADFRSANQLGQRLWVERS
jgi:hypothetical protein